MQEKTVNRHNIEAVILAGSRDFGRCPIASQVPLALWPVLGSSVLERLLLSLAKQRIRRAVICSNGDAPLLEQSIDADGSIEVQFLNEQLAVGTAGCIRDSAGDKKDTLLVVLPVGIVWPPVIEELIAAHLSGQSDLTVMFNPGDGNGRATDQPSGVYVCSTSVLEHIPEDGYFDIKEGLIPEMLHAGKTVHAATMANHVGNFRDLHGYVRSISDYLQNCAQPEGRSRRPKRTDSQPVWIAPGADIDSSARILGAVAVLNGAHIAEDAVVIGPSCIGPNVNVGKGSIIAKSMLWERAQVGPNCRIRQCVVDRRATVPANAVVHGSAIAFTQASGSADRLCQALKFFESSAGRINSVLRRLGWIAEKLPGPVRSAGKNVSTWFAAGLVLLAFVWSYRFGLAELWHIWLGSDEYSSGLLVPILAVYVLWSRRAEIAKCRLRPSIWGIFAFLAAQALRLFGLYYVYGSAERLSVAVSIAALVLLLFGWQLFRRVFTVLLFLLLMLPLPTRVQAAMALPLQHWATTSAVFVLEMIGYEVLQEGNLIHIGQATVAVSEACNGLRMITAFFVISGLVVLLARRAWWEKLIVLASSIPIALLCNTCRLAITAIAFTMLSGEQIEKLFHDFGGYAMMPLALVIVVAELWLLTKLTVRPTAVQVITWQKT
jgi:exosortase